MRTPTSHFVRVNGLQLHYTRAGVGPPALLLHGWPTHSALYRHVQARVTDERTLIALDLPGFGASDKPLGVEYSFAFYRNLLTGFLDQLEVESVGLAVHDLGGPIGVDWAVSHPARVRDLCVLNTLVFPELHWSAKAFLLAMRAPFLGELMSGPRFVRETLRFGVVNRRQITPEVAALYADVVREPLARRALCLAGQGLEVEHFETLDHELPRLDVPTLLLYGERDRILPDVSVTMSRLKATWPHAIDRPLGHAGHFLQEDCPEEVSHQLLDFWRKHP